MTNFYSKLMLGFLLLSTSTINAQTTTYCAPTWSGWAVNEPTEPITSVQFGTGPGSINNTTSATVSASTPRYEDFSTTSMNVQRGQTYDLKVKGNTDGNNTNYITVYFDWNGDGVFSNATPANAAAQQVLTNQPEKHQHTTAIINSTGADNVEMVHSVTIPNDAVLGSIRMRIVKNYNAPSPAPCANPFIFGQVEDYTLNITNGSCPAVSSFSENFDASTLTCCNMGVVPQCWHSISTATGANQIISNTTPASGTNNIYQFGYGTNLQSIVVMPEVNNINAGTHQFRFKLRANSGPGNLDFGYITDITNASTFVIIQTINVTNSTYNDPIAERTLIVPTTVPSTARLAIRNPGTSWAGFYWDDANWEPKPQTVCADPGSNVGDTGCVTFTYDGVSKTHTTVRGADGNIWLQQNLGSTQVASTMTDANSYGDVYQWGRWNDGHEKRTSTTTTVPTTNNPSGLTTTSNSFIIGSSTDWWDGGSLTDTWSAVSSANTSATEGCDPCKAIGTGWVMPTETDWTGIKTAESISNPATAFASNLKLPASGYRSSSTGNYTFVDQRGYYWSSTTSTLGAKYFYVGSTIANPSAGAMRGQGHAVRCIYKTAVSVNTVTVTTQNNVAATITAANGTLQLQAAITPTTANQAVTWSVQSGSTSATVDNSGLVTGLTNGTAVIRATSVADTTKFGELTVTVNISTANPCTAVQSFLETFETFTTFPENCWTGNYAPTPPAPAITIGGTATNKTVSLYSGFVTGDIIISSPEVSTIDGKHVLAFDVVSFSDATTSIQVGTLSDNTDFTTFASVGSPISPSVGTHTSISIPANAGHKYIAIKFIHGGGHKALQLDNIEWKTAADADKFDADKVKIYPNPTTGMFLIDTDIDVKSIEIYNTSGQRILKTNQKNINLENASNGLYIVNVYAADGTHASYKIIKK